MKYLIIFLLSFAIAFPALAAKTVKGTVPNFPPLQPPALGVSPNFSHNIEARGGFVPNQSSSSNPSEAGTVFSPVSSSVISNRASKSHKAVWVILVFILLAGVFVFIWYKRENL